MTEEEKGPLVVLAEERPIYIFSDYEESGRITCPGDKDCLIKEQFTLPVGRCIIRILEGSPGLGEEIPMTTPSSFKQKEEFVVRTCEECRYNPVARAVIEELRSPRAYLREQFTSAFDIPKMHAKLQGLSGVVAGGFAGRHHPEDLDDFFKNYLAPAVIKDMQKKSALAGMVKLEEQNMRRTTEAHLRNIQRAYNEQFGKMLENSAPGPEGPRRIFDGAVVKRAIDRAFGGIVDDPEAAPYPRGTPTAKPKDKEDNDADDDPGPFFY